MIWPSWLRNPPKYGEINPDWLLAAKIILAFVIVGYLIFSLRRRR